MWQAGIMPQGNLFRCLQRSLRWWGGVDVMVWALSQVSLVLEILPEKTRKLTSPSDYHP